jgi:hypothetical protein
MESLLQLMGLVDYRHNIILIMMLNTTLKPGLFKLSDLSGSMKLSKTFGTLGLFSR